MEHTSGELGRWANRTECSGEHNDQMTEMCGGTSATWMMASMAIANLTGCAHLMLKSRSWLEKTLKF